ncbi:MAG: phosphonate ABC transporter, permease protein PhnE [Nitrospinae bacterium]|nr:phosphonate ABC transporter, permease protein PhnE [Nitrospinota bacterium]
MTDSSQSSNPVFERPFYAKTRFLFIALLVIAVYGYGWRVTEIDLGELVRDVHLVKPLVRDLLHPDLFVVETESETAEAAFFLSDFLPGTVEDRETGDGPILVLSASRGTIGDRIEVEGKRFKPHAEGSITWVNSIEQEFPLGSFATDDRGNFSKEVIVPPTARGSVQTVRAVVVLRTGGWRMSDTLKLTVDKMVETVFLALMATTFAIIVAMPLSFLGARNLMMGNPVSVSVYYAVRTMFNVLRSIEPLVMAILFAVWVGIGPFAGVLALGVHSIAALGKLFSEQVESIDPGPVEAITATGATPMQVVLFAVLPQVIPQFLALSFYRWDINVRMSTIIGFVGGGGIGFLLQQWINLLQYNQAGTALLAIACVVITLDMISARIREKIMA